MGRQVKKTVNKRKNLRPYMSDMQPMSGAVRKDNKPLMPKMIPFIRNVFSGKVFFKT